MNQYGILLIVFINSIRKIENKMHKNKQAPNTVLMIRPANFFPNPETEGCNSFQSNLVATTEHEDLLTRACNEFDHVVKTLTSIGIKVHVLQDTSTPCQPDAIFPNNWFSTHEDGKANIYPMYSSLRRTEKSAIEKIKAILGEDHSIKSITDYSLNEAEESFFEGTGALCIDHDSSIGYIGISNRANRDLGQEICSDLGLKPVFFNTTDSCGNAVYHTNVMLSIASDFALLGSDMIPNLEERESLIQSLEDSGKTIIRLTNRQVQEFAGNAIELSVEGNNYLAMSLRGKGSLTPEQIERIEKFATIITSPLPTVELSGGSMRCMIAGIHC